MLECIAELRAEGGAPLVVNPARCATDAREVLGLWRAIGQPPPADLASDLCAVIRWARSAPDRLAARDIRAEGWPDGTDRSRSMATLCRRDRWGERVTAAHRWARESAKKGPAGIINGQALAIIAEAEKMSADHLAEHGKRGFPAGRDDPRRMAIKAWVERHTGGWLRLEMDPDGWRDAALASLAAGKGVGL